MGHVNVCLSTKIFQKVNANCINGKFMIQRKGFIV